MGKRRRPSWKLERDLRLDIKSCKNNHLSVEELVDHLRSSYHRKYGSIQLQPFTERVQHVLLQLQNPNNDKKPKRMRDSEEEDGGGRESSTLSSMPESHDSSSDREDMLEEEDVDLMQSMFRSTYNQQGVKNNIPNSKKFEEPEMVYDNNDGNRNRKRKNDGMLLKGGQGNIGGEVNKPMFKDIGGIDALLEDLERKVLFPLHNPQVPRHAGVTPIKGVLLHGPPGCGKTTLARAIANETGVPFYQISSTDVVSGISGASEENIRELFSKAHRTAPSIVFIDEIDAIASKRENLHREMERRIVTQLITCMDESHSLVKPIDAKGTTLSEGSNGRTGHVLVIGATNRLDAIDPALRRSGRLEYEIPLGIPDENARVQILSMLTRKLRVEGALDLMKIARSTPGFVGADLKALTLQAYDLVLKRIAGTMKVELSRTLVDGEDAQKWWKKPWAPEELENLNINMADFEEAAKLVQPSTRKEGFSAIPNVTWEDVGGLDSLRQEFDLYIVRRIKYPEHYMGFGAGLEKGFLLYGPPGCGKTLIAKAVANEAGANFIHIKGPEVLNKYVGESELAIRTLFSRARTCSPCILFFDEVDALTAKHGEEGIRVVESVLKQLLIELDGGDERKDVYVIGATNCPEVMNPAILRPGRLGELLYVPLPSPDERGLILKALARKMDMDFNVDLMTIGRDDACKNLSGADLSKLINKAAMVAFKDSLIALDTSPGYPTVTESHFRRALEKISPSVSDKQIKYYQHLSKTLRAS